MSKRTQLHPRCDRIAFVFRVDTNSIWSQLRGSFAGNEFLVSDESSAYLWFESFAACWPIRREVKEIAEGNGTVLMIRPQTRVDEPYTTVGAGRFSSRVWKEGAERSGWRYAFDVYCQDQATENVSQRFSPSDIKDLANLCHVLVSVLLDDGCVSHAEREDLESLLDMFEKDKVGGKCEVPTSLKMGLTKGHRLQMT